MPSGCTKNSPKSGRGLSHVTPKIFGKWSNISPKLLELETSNLVHGFVWRMTSRRIKISPKTGRSLGHVTHTIFGSTVSYPSDSLASCYKIYMSKLNVHRLYCWSLLKILFYQIQQRILHLKLLLTYWNIESRTSNIKQFELSKWARCWKFCCILSKTKQNYRRVNGNEL